MEHRTQLYLAARSLIDTYGWPLFLLGRSKRPVANCPACPSSKVDPTHDPAACTCLTCHGPYAATNDPHRLAAIFDAIPGGLLAVATGRVSWLVVIDVDPRHGGIIDHRLMAPTMCSATGSGGWHLYYRHPGIPVPNSQSKLAPGIDVRGEGGYVVLPPSLHPATHVPYRWANTRPVEEMPRALIEASLPRSAPSPARLSAVPAPTNRVLRGAGGISSPTALLTAHLDAVARAPEGKRRTTFYGAARGVARMVAAGAITELDALAALVDAGRRAEQTDRDINAAIVGAFRDEHVALQGVAA